jgi:plastocyanin
MATIDVWIQIENHAWDVSPNNIDRMTGQTIQQITGKAPQSVTLTSPVTGAVRKNVTMYRPLSADALILRRYTQNWAAPDDRKVNPWDLNEPNPTDTGTMGTIPGPVIECSIGDKVVVHFRNIDTRTDSNGTLLAAAARTHSLHPHGFAFFPTSDGAYPLSPPDSSQPTGPEAPLWGGATLKQGDRVPPGGTFNYTWDTHSWPATAGVWLYHDHSICDEDNVGQGAIGIIVIHNPADAANEVLAQDLPGGSPNGNLVHLICFGGLQGQVLPQLLAGLGAETEPGFLQHGDGKLKELSPARMIRQDNVQLEVSDALQLIHICLPFYVPPPANAQYLQLFHTLGDAGMCINGRKYMGNTPTVLAGANTKMRFGVVGMGSDTHTFHIHGHRWVLTGPDGTNPGALQNSPEVRGVSQFEDTRLLGPANSFAFTIQQGTFFGAPPEPPGPLGEYHMHCHVLAHMMDGMMGSLLIVGPSTLAFGLPRGIPCPSGSGGAPQVTIQDFLFSPATIMINAGQTVTWTNAGASPHTVTSNPGTLACAPTSTENFNSGNMAPGATFAHTFNTPGSYSYHCEVHGCAMSGTVQVM